MSMLLDAPVVQDARAMAALADADGPVAEAWRSVHEVACGDPPAMGLSAGERPAADVEVMAGAMAAAEYALAARMHRAAASGCLPLPARGGMLAARGWSTVTARRLARCAALADGHPSVARAWAAGVITSEHVDPVARAADRFTSEELASLLAELAPRWGAWSPQAVARFVAAAARMLHPPTDPAPEEADAHATRDLSFAMLGDSVILAGALPRVEGELVVAAIDALAERLRSEADHVPAGARRADALVQLVNDAHASGSLPTRGGLPVALTVTLQQTGAGDPIWSTSRGHQLTDAEARWASCDAALTPLLTATDTVRVGLASSDLPPSAASEAPTPRGARTPTEAPTPPGAAPHAPTPAGAAPDAPTPPPPGVRIAALAATLFGTRTPLAAGRTERTATPAQRRALAVRDRGCVIPGCGVPAEAAQVHHLAPWTDGGSTDLPNLATLCWAHHRQVDLRMWTLTPLPPGDRPPATPEPGAPPGTPWPGNNGAPFIVTRTSRHTWRR